MFTLFYNFFYFEKRIFIFVCGFNFNIDQYVRFGPKVSQIGPKWDFIRSSDFNTFWLADLD